VLIFGLINASTRRNRLLTTSKFKKHERNN
jgi:hypothetical protein